MTDNFCQPRVISCRPCVKDRRIWRALLHEPALKRYGTDPATVLAWAAVAARQPESIMAIDHPKSSNESAAVAAILAHAKQHQQATADETSPHWVWMQGKDELELSRTYPLQGITVRQNDVTIWSKQ
jgi:hypothetical protein